MQHVLSIVGSTKQDSSNTIHLPMQAVSLSKMIEKSVTAPGPGPTVAVSDPNKASPSFKDFV